MRLWSINPTYLDRQGLTALWREGLGAIQSLNLNKGYHHHPQLERFKKLDYAKLALNSYLTYVHHEAYIRGYNFDKSKIKDNLLTEIIPVTTEQVRFEMQHLHKKLSERSIAQFRKYIEPEQTLLNPIFKLIDGPLEPWEKIK